MKKSLYIGSITLLIMVLFTGCGGGSLEQNVSIDTPTDIAAVVTTMQPIPQPTTAAPTRDFGNVTFDFEARQAVSDELRTEIVPLVMEDLKLLYNEMRAIMPLSGPVYRRFGVDVFAYLRSLISEIENGGHYRGNIFFPSNFTQVGRGLECKDAMLVAAAEWLANRMNRLNERTGGIMHFLSFVVGDINFEELFELEVMIDRYAGRAAVQRPDNVSTDILLPGEIAFMSIRQGTWDIDYDLSILLPFYEQIQDFAHLIIDIRGHVGGDPWHFNGTVLRQLIGEPVYTKDVQFFSHGFPDWFLQFTYQNIQPELAEYFDELAEEMLSIFYCAYIFLQESNKPYFNEADMQDIAFVRALERRITPLDDGFPFAGQIWILVDERTASAGERIVLDSMSSGFATVVGENTMGVMPAQTMYIMLPNTGIAQRMDIGYMVDAYGRNLQEHGITPDYLNRQGMCALQTVLAMIEEKED